jgi:hypothetical protein
MNEKNILNLLFKNDKNKPKIEKIEFNVDYDKNYDVFYNDFEYEFEDNMKKFLIQKIDKENYYKNVFIIINIKFDFFNFWFIFIIFKQQI